MPPSTNPFKPAPMLEPEFAEPYMATKHSPGPKSNAAFLTAIHPVIESAVRTHVWQPNPLILSRARQMALESLPNYDPARSRLKSFLFSQLQGLKRVNRQQTSVLKVPERLAQESYRASQAEDELTAELGRPPSTGELAERTGVSLKRLATLRKFRNPVAEGQFVNPESGTEEYSGPTTAPWRETGRMWRDMVYEDLDPYHQLIMEHTLGLHGRRKLSNQELAAKLKKSQGAISQAKSRIQAMLDQEESLSPFGSM